MPDDDLQQPPEPCQRRHPGWGNPVDYRRLGDDSPPRVRRVSAPTLALLIDHAFEPHPLRSLESSGYLGTVTLATDTLLHWVGSSFRYTTPARFTGAHVLQVLNGDQRGACVEVRAEEEGHERHLPDTMPAADRI